MPNYGYYDYYGYSQPYSSGSNLGLIGSGILLALSSTLILYLIIAWIFRSIGLYHLAKNRGISHAWFSWVPFLSQYILGRLINDKVVLGDNIVTTHASFFLPFLGLLTSSITTEMNEISWICSVFTLAVWVYETSALWRLFKIYRPKSRCSFTIWSLILTSGFFIFAIRNDKPFDELDPTKVYENYYGDKKVIDTEYNRDRAEIRTQEKEREETLRNTYQDQLNQDNLSTEQKDHLREQYYETRQELKKEADNLIKAENKEYQAEIETLDKETTEHLDPVVTSQGNEVIITAEEPTEEIPVAEVSNEINPNETGDEITVISDTEAITPEIDHQINETINAIDNLINNRDQNEE